MAGNHRTRRLTEDRSAGQRKLEAVSSAPAEPPAAIDPSEVLEPPPPQHAAARLEVRQREWFRRRETVEEEVEKAAAPAPSSAENAGSDPKG